MYRLLLPVLFAVALCGQTTTVRNHQLQGTQGESDRVRVTESDGSVAEKLIESLAAFTALIQQIAELEARLAAIEVSQPSTRKVGVRLIVDEDDPGRTWVFPDPARNVVVYMGLRLTEGVDYQVLDSRRIRLVAEYGDGLAGAVVVADYDVIP